MTYYFTQSFIQQICLFVVVKICAIRSKYMHPHTHKNSNDNISLSRSTFASRRYFALFNSSSPWLELLLCAWKVIIIMPECFGILLVFLCRTLQIRWSWLSMNVLSWEANTDSVSKKTLRFGMTHFIHNPSIHFTK